MIEESITDRELEDMHTAGVRGVRINLAAQTPGLKLEQAPAFKDVPQLARAAVAAAPDRVVWGTDWPHPMGKEMMPNDGDLADMLADWVPDEAQRKKVLVDNPARLYNF